jgi:hypothetical protein
MKTKWQPGLSFLAVVEVLASVIILHPDMIRWIELTSDAE